MPEPALIVAPTRWGGVTAIRSLARAGIKIWAGTSTREEIGLRSRYLSRVMRTPPHDQPQRLAAWLGRADLRGTRPVLVPTDDIAAWAYALHRDELAERYHLYAPGADTLRRLMDKATLSGESAAAGLPGPLTVAVDPESGQPPLPFPFFLKPRTRLGTTHAKGAVVRDDEEFRVAVARLAGGAGTPAVDSLRPEATGLVAQELIRPAGGAGYNVSAFITAEGDLLGVRASRKVLDRPPLTGGYGVCFDEAPVSNDLAERIAGLCRRTGFFGAFEVEFLPREGELLLVDFNPRPTGAVAFDVARGLDLPRMLYAAAIGDGPEMRRQAATAARTAAPGRRGYCDRPKLEAGLRLWRRKGLLDRRQARRWLKAHRGQLVQPANDPRDPLPGLSAYWDAALSVAMSTLRRR